MPYVETNGIETYYEEQGEGQPIVFVHPVYSSHYVWQPQVETLSEDYRVVTYDLRDHGHTESASSRYTSHLLADDLQVLINELELENPVVCGLSIGGYVAQRHAVMYSGEASGYIFANTTTPAVYTVDERLFQQFNRTLSKVNDVVGFQRLGAIVEKVSEVVNAGDSRSNDAIKEELREKTPMPTDAEASRIGYALEHWTKEAINLTEISVPVLYLYGDSDRNFNQTHIGRMALDLEEFEAVEIPDAGHVANLDNPEMFTNAVQRFMGERI